MSLPGKIVTVSTGMDGWLHERSIILDKNGVAAPARHVRKYGEDIQVLRILNENVNVSDSAVTHSW